MKKLPIGLDDFKKLIEGNYYFVDKSLFIKEILEDSSETIFLPRPRRFGKSLNMSMLKYFLDIKGAEENKELFKDLVISQEKEILDVQGKSPIIYISFKEVKENNWENCFLKVSRLIQNLFNE